jgi:hypothetical protein
MINPGEGELRKRARKAIENSHKMAYNPYGSYDYFSDDDALDGVMKIVDAEIQARDARLAFYRERWVEAAREEGVGLSGNRAEEIVAAEIARWEAELAKKGEGS